MNLECQSHFRTHCGTSVKKFANLNLMVQPKQNKAELQQNRWIFSLSTEFLRYRSVKCLASLTAFFSEQTLSYLVQDLLGQKAAVTFLNLGAASRCHMTQIPCRQQYIQEQSTGQ